MTITLVIPCYNEETNLQKGVLDKIGNYTKEKDIFKEVLIVDDGSNDSTKGKISKSYLPKFSKFRLIENQHQGKAYAVSTGIRQAKGEYILFTDFDQATPIEESKKLIEEAEKGNDIIIGSRQSRREGAPLIRKVMAMGFKFLRSYVIGLPQISDTQCGFKLFKTAIARDILDRLIVYKNGIVVQGPSVSAGFDLEVLFIASKQGYKLAEVPITWRHAETRRVLVWKDSIEGLKDITAIKLNDIRGKYR